MSHVRRLRTTERIFFVTINLRGVHNNVCASPALACFRDGSAALMRRAMKIAELALCAVRPILPLAVLVTTRRLLCYAPCFGFFGPGGAHTRKAMYAPPL
jgi:hypothetical protein